MDINPPTDEFNSLVQIFNIEKKGDLIKYCNNLVVNQSDFFLLILAAQQNVLAPYSYANHFERNLPSDLTIKDSEIEAFRKNGVGKFTTKPAKKFASKIFQFPLKQRSRAAHLFYTPDHKHWLLFYFDNRDITQTNNHWKHGSHIHLVTSLWPELSLNLVWSKVVSGNLDFQKKIHLRYVRNSHQAYVGYKTK